MWGWGDQELMTASVFGQAKQTDSSSRCFLCNPSTATLGPWGAPSPHPMWMDTAMHDMGSLDLPQDWANLAASTVPGHVEGGGQPVLSFEQCFILFSPPSLVLRVRK